MFDWLIGAKGGLRMLVAALALISSATPFQSSAQNPQSRTAEWGTLTPYSNAVALDSPLRQARNQLWNGKATEGPLNDSSQPTLLNYQTTHPHITDLELQGSTAVVVGVVRVVRAYLSSDHTTIYTEMSMRVQQVLQNISGRSLPVNSIISVARAGGVVRLPSGKILIRGCQYESMPHMTRQYLFVMKYSQAADEFLLVEGFELNGDHVFVIDSVQSTFVAATQQGRPTRRVFLLDEYGLSSAQFVQAVIDGLSGSATQ